MIWNIKIIYLLSLGAVLTPTAMRWSEEIKIPHKQALLPPEMPYTSEKNEKQLQQLLAHDLWDKERKGLSGKSDKEIIEGKELSKEQQLQQQKLEWTLKAIGYQNTDSPTAMIAEKDKNKIYHENDSLPDGSILKKITINSIMIEKAGVTKNVYLFKEN